MSKHTGGGDSLSKLWSGGRNEPDLQPVVRLATSSAAESRAYVAFETREGAPRLHIHCATQPSRFPNYHYLLDIVFDHDFNSMFTLIYSFMTVEVIGKNLQPVVHAISYGNCERIREFHRKLYETPESGGPVIESIKITVAAEPPSDD